MLDIYFTDEHVQVSLYDGDNRIFLKCILLKDVVVRVTDNKSGLNFSVPRPAEALQIALKLRDIKELL
jgi:hypothetical protein